MKSCCRVYGNQYRTWVVFCPKHEMVVQSACRELGVTPEEFLHKVLSEFIGVHKGLIDATASS